MATVPPPPLRMTGERPEEELARLLVSPRTVRALARDRIEALVELQGGFRPLLELLVRHRLTALAGSRLQEVAGDRVPPWFQDAVTTAVRGNRARALMAEASTRTLARTLESRGIAVLPLKGFVLGQAIYGDTGLRELGDVDLLVAPSDFDAACDVLRASGYEPADERPVEGRPVLHRSFAARQGARIRVELHWRIHWYESAFSEQLLALSRRGDSGLREPSPAHGLAGLLLFWIRDGMIGLRYPADLAAWWDRFGTQVAPGAVADIAAEHPCLERALAAAAVTATEVFGLPSQPFDRLLSDHDRRAVVACKLANWTARGDLDQVEANRVLIDSLVSPPGGQRSFAGRQLRSHSVAHPLKLLLRFPIALWAVRGERTWATSATPSGR